MEGIEKKKIRNNKPFVSNTYKNTNLYALVSGKFIRPKQNNN